jgi:predicted ribosomally synthesized peptide with SipW-like signal peptide
MKRIALSLMTIAAVVVVAVGATSAYFSDGKVIDGNTFATGTVTLGNVSGMPVTVSGLTPGKTITKTIGFRYNGSVNADIYLGNRGEVPPPNYLADKLVVTIIDQSNGSWLFNDTANKLAGDWLKMVSNGSAGWRYYEVRFKLDELAGNEYQNVTNTDTEFLLYAVQAEGPKPDIKPYCVLGTSGDPDDWTVASYLGC